jgi:Predicted transcriptional regulators
MSLFNNSQAIYLQIATYICDKILSGEWNPEERIPSVRELAVIMEVNSNTIMHTFDSLQGEEIIFVKRGLGYFVSPNAVKIIKTNRRKKFMEQVLPDFFRQLSLLEIPIEEIITLYDKHQNKEDKQ